MQEIYLCGVRIDVLCRSEAVGRALGSEKRPCRVVTPNALMLESCRRDAHLRELLCRAELSLPDGAGVLLRARRQGTPLPERIAGISFGEDLLAEAERQGLRVFLLGGREGVSIRAAERLLQKHPRLQICGMQHGYFDRTGEENAAILERIQQARTDVLIVCLGFPLQEEWIMENTEALSSVRVVAALGGSLDVWAGRVRRAPRPLQRMGLEWAWRMAMEPRRLRDLPRLLRTLLRS